MLRLYGTICKALEKAAGVACLALMACIVVAMACQIFFRYALNTPLSYTDEISLVSLTWLTFIGAGWIYRKRSHIAVELVAGKDNNSVLSRSLDVIGQIAVVTILVILASQALELMPRALKLKLGTMELSRFVMHFLPLMIGCALIILFAIEHCLNSLTGKREEDNITATSASE